MYMAIKDKPHMTMLEASKEYSDSYILMQMDDEDSLDPDEILFEPAGLVLYTGDDCGELFILQEDLAIPFGVVVEGQSFSSIPN